MKKGKWKQCIKRVNCFVSIADDIFPDRSANNTSIDLGVVGDITCWSLFVFVMRLAILLQLSTNIFCLRIERYNEVRVYEFLKNTVNFFRSNDCLKVAER